MPSLLNCNVFVCSNQTKAVSQSRNRALGPKDTAERLRTASGDVSEDFKHYLVEDAQNMIGSPEHTWHICQQPGSGTPTQWQQKEGRRGMLDPLSVCAKDILLTLMVHVCSLEQLII